MLYFKACRCAWKPPSCEHETGHIKTNLPSSPLLHFCGLAVYAGSACRLLSPPFLFAAPASSPDLFIKAKDDTTLVVTKPLNMQTEINWAICEVDRIVQWARSAFRNLRQCATLGGKPATYESHRKTAEPSNSQPNENGLKKRSSVTVIVPSPGCG